MGAGRDGAVRLALVDDYELVVVGLAQMFAPYAGRVEIAELDADEPVTTPVDVALFDTFAQGEADRDAFGVLVSNPLVRHAVVYTWAFDQGLIDIALGRGGSGYLSKTLPAGDLVDAVERIDRGERVVSDAPSRRGATKGDWPGRNEGLTQREAEIVALITQGHSNLEIAALTYLSINSIKSHIRNAYRKVGVSTRAQAILWGVDHGFKPFGRAVDRWRR